ncbi:MAG: NAD-dependent epimerase/dehydratase family protein [Roseivirga sp.]|nr:NAD-dependent epimerase/dehydratase family protein [Roseivirga sp.]
MRVIITGSTGMVGKSVLLECLRNDKISSVLVVNRRPVGLTHPKLTELLHQDFLDLNPLLSQLEGYDACFHCMGVSAVGMKEADYTRLTYELTVHWVDTLYKLNPDMVFNYVSGAGTDSSEKGRAMWARVKGKTENKVLNKGFKDAYAFRPGGIIVEKGVTSAKGSVSRLYALLKPLLILMKNSRYVTTGANIGKAMINSLSKPGSNKHLENLDIDELAKLPTSL